MNGPKSDQGEVYNFPRTLNVIIVKIWASLENETATPGPHSGGLATYTMKQGLFLGLNDNLPAIELVWGI